MPISVSIKEIYPAILGESAWAGFPGVIVRLAGCNLRCTYCDTAYAWEGGREFSIFALLPKIIKYKFEHVLITGGEPLAQPGSALLMERLLKAGRKVMLETNGTFVLDAVPGAVHVVMDVKSAGSGEAGKINPEALKGLKPSDEIKFVLTNRKDYLSARATYRHVIFRPSDRIIFSPAFGMLDPADLAGWMLKDRVEARLGLQIHKYIYPPDRRRT